MAALRDAPATACSWASDASRWPSPTEEKEAIAYHEAGHAVCAAVLPNADPVHKVTILPIGMALGVTQQLPVEERHIYRQDYIEDWLVVAHGRPDRRGARVRRDLRRAPTTTSSAPPSWPARWCASGACPTGSARWRGARRAPVFLGEDLMHTRDYSDETARVIDEEVERILREQEQRCREVLVENRNGLDLVARIAARARDDRRQRGRTGWWPSAARAARRSRSSASGTPATVAARAPVAWPTSTPPPGPTADGSRPNPLGLGTAPRGAAGLSQLGHRRPEVGGGDGAEEAGLHHTVGVGHDGGGHGLDAVAVVEVLAGARPRPLARRRRGRRGGGPAPTRPRQLSQVAEVNTATSHGASGRTKSARSSCWGTEYPVRTGASGRRRRCATAATASTTRARTTAVSARSTHRACQRVGIRSHPGLPSSGTRRAQCPPWGTTKTHEAVAPAVAEAATEPVGEGASRAASPRSSTSRCGSSAS